MHYHEVDLPERDKLAAGKGLVSDVFLYYPKGIAFPVFVDNKMEKVVIRPFASGGYRMSIPTMAGVVIIGANNELFASIVDKARDTAVRNETGEHTGHRQLQPA